MHLADNPGLVSWCGIIYTITWALIDGLQASSTYLETHEVTDVPSQPLEAPQVYYVEKKGPPLSMTFESPTHHYGIYGFHKAS